MGEVLILQNTVPETLNSRTLHPVSWDGYPLKHTSDSQEMLGQVTLQLQIVKMATTAHCPIGDLVLWSPEELLAIKPNFS